jgi:hypothetical protein
MWEKADAPDMQSRGKGTAYRQTDNDHYAEVKTQGHSSNTTVTGNEILSTMKVPLLIQLT